MWGWQVTTPEAIDAQKWEDWFDTYVNDRYDLDIKDRFAKAGNPYAYQTMLARMLEVVRKKYWKPDEKRLQQLINEYLKTAKETGLSCANNVCGNESLVDFVEQSVSNTESKELIKNLVGQLGNIHQNSAPMKRKTLSKPLPAAGRKLASKSQTPSQQPSNPGISGKKVPNARHADGKSVAVKGYKMEESNRASVNTDNKQSNRSKPVTYWLSLITALLVVLGFWLGKKY